MLHTWKMSPREAIALQKKLAPLVLQGDELHEVKMIAGVDVGFEKTPDALTLTRAVVTLMTYPDLCVIETVLHRQPSTMPYIPGLLSFRELPAILNAFSQLQHKPDLIMVDGQGIAHPRRLGIASHLGLWLDLPTLGVAKKRLCGQHEQLPETKGASVFLYDQKELIGAVLRSREGIKPLYISIGHKISLDSALIWVKNCLKGYRLPEPTRQADRIASRRDQKKRRKTSLQESLL